MEEYFLGGGALKLRENHLSINTMIKVLKFKKKKKRQDNEKLFMKGKKFKLISGFPQFERYVREMNKRLLREIY